MSPDRGFDTLLVRSYGPSQTNVGRHLADALILSPRSAGSRAIFGDTKLNVYVGPVVRRTRNSVSNRQVTPSGLQDVALPAECIGLDLDDRPADGLAVAGTEVNHILANPAAHQIVAHAAHRVEPDHPPQLV